MGLLKVGWWIDPEQKFKRARRVFLHEAHGELSRIAIRRSGALKPKIHRHEDFQFSCRSETM
jgi:hypothetical protein